jgi:putative ABC transport system substrate-binding protein
MTVSSEQSAVSSTTRGRKRVTRRVVAFTCLLFAVFLRGVSAEAQQPVKVPQIGYLGGVSFAVNAARVEAFRKGLRELGYEEGKNIIIEWRLRREK